MVMVAMPVRMVVVVRVAGVRMRVCHYAMNIGSTLPPGHGRLCACFPA